MEQLVFELAAPDPPSFENFLAGSNAEVVSALTRFAAGEASETGLLLWGAPGVGKSHLLRSAVRFAQERGAAASLLSSPDELEGVRIDRMEPCALFAVDDVDHATEAGQAQLFSLFNAAKAQSGHLIAASTVPLAALPLREDVRTRLGWGLVYEVASLPDAEKPTALLDYARRRGFTLPDDVIRYLLAHGRRDMPTLLATLAALDRHSLATKRAITLPLLRAWLQREMRLDP